CRRGCSLCLRLPAFLSDFFGPVLEESNYFLRVFVLGGRNFSRGLWGGVYVFGGSRLVRWTWPSRFFAPSAIDDFRRFPARTQGSCAGDIRVGNAAWRSFWTGNRWNRWPALRLANGFVCRGSCRNYSCDRSDLGGGATSRPAFGSCAN